MIDDAWVIGDMDEGIVFGAATKRQCLAFIDRYSAPIIKVHRYGPGDYEYVIGYVGEDEVDNQWVMSLVVARRHSFDLDEDVRRCSDCNGYCRQNKKTWACKACGHEEEEK